MDLIDREEWSSLDADVKGDAYEGLLEKNAQDTKGSAGQYFTPRPLIRAIVDVIRPAPGETICDPACDTGGFLLAAHDYVLEHHPSMSRDQRHHLKYDALRGIDIVDGVVRLCAMNLLLHGIGAMGGAGETVRRKLLQTCNVHTLLRLPTGIFYAQGVKANVLFFDRKPGREKPWTTKLWVYDLRTNKHFTLKRHPLRREDLDDFVELYRPKDRSEREETWSEDNPKGRWRAYDYDALIERDKTSLDLFWIRDEALEDTENLTEPDVIAQEIVEDLRAALEEFEEIAAELEETPAAHG